MSQIEITCIGSDAMFTNTPNIFSGGNVDTVKFKFDDSWSNFPHKTAVFYNCPKESHIEILDTDNTVRIPKEMLLNKSKLSIGVVGTNAEDDVKTSKILTYIVNQGAITDEMEITAPTPDVWLQLFSIVKHNKDKVDDMQLIVDESQMSNKANKDLSNVSDDDLVNKGIARIVTGVYTGDENPSQFIDLGFTPSSVEVQYQGRGYGGETSYTGAFIVLGSECYYQYSVESAKQPIIEIVDGGFKVYYTYNTVGMSIYTNLNGIFHYIATK